MVIFFILVVILSVPTKGKTLRLMRGEQSPYHTSMATAKTYLKIFKRKNLI